MWQVFVNPKTKQIDVFTEDGHELRALTDLKIDMNWGSDKVDARNGVVMLNVNAVAQLVFERPKPKE